MNMIIFFVFVIIIAFVFLFARIPKDKSNFYKKNKKIKGIVFFDIDDTLTNLSHQEITNVIEYCKDKGYKIGIVTASTRTPEYICNKNKRNAINSEWATDNLCNELYQDNFNLFNSLVVTNGSFVFNFPNYEKDEYFYGKQKGWQMLQTAKQQNIDPSNTFLFDDNIYVLKGAEKINPKGIFIHIDNKVNEKKLNTTLISKILV